MRNRYGMSFDEFEGRDYGRFEGRMRRELGSRGVGYGPRDYERDWGMPMREYYEGRGFGHAHGETYDPYWGMPSREYYEGRGFGYNPRDYERDWGMSPRESYEGRGFGYSPRDYEREYWGRSYPTPMGRSEYDRYYGVRSYGRGDMPREWTMPERFEWRGMQNRNAMEGFMSGPTWASQRGWSMPWERPWPSFHGRGPKGYKRSDERIREDVCDRFTDSYELDASNIEVKVHQGEVTLSGTVSERYFKHMAEWLCESISGVQDIHNQLRVEFVEPTMSATSSTDRNGIPQEKRGPEGRRGMTA